MLPPIDLVAKHETREEAIAGVMKFLEEIVTRQLQEVGDEVMVDITPRQGVN